LVYGYVTEEHQDELKGVAYNKLHDLLKGCAVLVVTEVYIGDSGILGGVTFRGSGTLA